MAEVSLNSNQIIFTFILLSLMLAAGIGAIIFCLRAIGKSEAETRAYEQRMKSQYEVNQPSWPDLCLTCTKPETGSKPGDLRKTNQNQCQSSICNISPGAVNQTRTKPEIDSKPPEKTEPEDEGLCPHGYSNPNVDCPMCYDAPDDDDD